MRHTRLVVAVLVLGSLAIGGAMLVGCGGKAPTPPLSLYVSSPITEATNGTADIQIPYPVGNAVIVVVISDNPQVQPVSPVTLDAGKTLLQFAVNAPDDTVSDASTTTVTFTASASGYVDATATATFIDK